MKTRTALAALLILALGSIFAQSSLPPIVEWNTWETNRNQTEGRKTLVYVYTDWCTLCKKMEREAFTDSTIQTLVAAEFTLVGLNAENKAELNFQGEQYEYVRKGNLGYHELAAYLLDGRLAFPSLVFLSEEGEVIQAIHGYHGKQHLEMLLRYYGEDYYRNTPWTSFQRQYSTGQITDDK